MMKRQQTLTSTTKPLTYTIVLTGTLLLGIWSIRKIRHRKKIFLDLEANKLSIKYPKRIASTNQIQLTNESSSMEELPHNNPNTQRHVRYNIPDTPDSNIPTTPTPLQHRTSLNDNNNTDDDDNNNNNNHLNFNYDNDTYENHNNNNYMHPEGPNIGPGSETSWLEKENLPEKTDLLQIKDGKLILIMIGLPGTGKTYIARKVARYLRWINYRTRVFCLARYRQTKLGKTKSADFYDTNDKALVKARLEVLDAAMDDIINYLNRGGEIAIMDGTNTSAERRQIIRDRITQETKDGRGHFQIMWVESICHNAKVIEHNLNQLRQSSPDFVADHDFYKRVEYYKTTYLTVQENEGTFVKMFDAGKKFELHSIHGFLPTKIMSFLMNLHIIQRPIFLTRHGESIFNTKGLIGGDSGLSQKGDKYALVLADFCRNDPDMKVEEFAVWTSTMRRARQTASNITCTRYVEWRSLREIEVGTCDGLSYAQVKEKFPLEYKAREEDKLRYRYPRGESYLDILNRLEPVIFELERQQCPVLIIAHQAVLRCLYAYFLDLPTEEVPYLSIPLHTVIKLQPQAYGCNEKRYKMLIDS